MPVTQRQIAEHLGISHQAVSFALGKRPGEVSEATRQKVLKTAQSLGYRANTAAKAIATGRFGAFGFLMAQRSSLSTVHGGVLQGIHEILEAENIHLTLTIAPEAGLADTNWMPKMLAHEMIDALIINYTHGVPKPLTDAIRRHRIPAVWMNTKRPNNCVYFGDLDAAYQATRRLISLGHTNIIFSDITRGMEDSGELHYSRSDREAGYNQAMTEAGLKIRHFYPNPSPGGSAMVDETISLLKSPNRPTAVVGYGGDGRVWLNAAYATQLKLGHDFSFVTFRTEPMFLGPRVDTMLLPEAELGRQAARMLLELLKSGKNQKPVSVQIPWVEGETVGPAPAHRAAGRR